MDAALEARTIGKVTRRLIPFLILCYFVAYLDRVNVGFAALTMKVDLGLTDKVYGFASGVFFLAYFLFEVPSNLFLERLGARRWIARIMFSWGIVSGGAAFVGGETGFVIQRILLGIAEAGFFPGIIFYLTLWFPQAYRGRIVGAFMAAIPASSVIGAPLSSLLLYLDGYGGLHGWQWMFIIEALPAVILAFVVLNYLTDRPADALWLADDERAWLAERMAREQRTREQAHQLSVGRALLNPRVLALGLVYFGAVATNYGIGFWLPQIIQGFGGLSKLQIGLITAIPYVVGRRSDRLGERVFHVAFPLGVSVVAIAAAALLDDPFLKMTALTITGFGAFAVLGVFWTLPAGILSGAAAAAGIAVINATGNLAGFVGPFAMGWIKDATGSFSYGLLLISALALLSLVTVLIIGHDGRTEAAGRAAVPAE